MPAVGKTTVAKLLAKELDLPLVGGGDILKAVSYTHLTLPTN